MTDFTTNIDMNVRMMNEKLRVDRNFDILQRDVLIGGKRTHFYFIDGFVPVSYTHLTLPTTPYV